MKNGTKRATLASISKLHNDNSKKIHGNGIFLAWHRLLIYIVESALLEIDPLVTFLYWDWTKDSQAPEKSIIWQNKYFGGNGSSKDKCVTGSKFAMQLKYPNIHCLKRAFKGGSKLSSFSNGPSIEMILSRNSDYSGIAKALESSPHATVHMQVGGKGGDVSTMYSTNDPIFFLHHTFIDMLWAEWQARNGEKGLTYGSSIKSTDILVGFGITAGNVTNNNAKPLCVQYKRWSAPLPNANSNIKQKAKSRTIKKTVSQTSMNFNYKKSTTTYVSIKASRVHDLAIGILNGTVEGYKVPGDDRTEAHVLRTSEPIDEDWIIMNNMNVEDFREEEELQDAINQALNMVEGFDPTEGSFDIGETNDREESENNSEEYDENKLVNNFK
jgi:hypothetical protein